MRNLALIFSITCLGAAATASADQLAWLSKSDVAIAVANGLSINGEEQTFLSYCEPCGEHDTPALMTVAADAIVARRVADSGSDVFYEVAVDGKGQDLAYLFVERSGYFLNVGHMFGLGGYKTSAVLTAEQVAALVKPAPANLTIQGVIDDNIVPGQPQFGGDADLRIKFGNNDEYILDFSVVGQDLADSIASLKPVKACVYWNGKTAQGHEGTIITPSKITFGRCPL